ncbi:GMC family oxidoreductase [Microbacterium sp. ASV49]|uniref:FAD-dependent oxidoreductase n=1 Tax=Microbacterium candidum TaxID=3041922 RepID=A0ABT7N0G4_9MICO|nr:FAD-dependent oxidoreductase [Microbacterium sp. ASV49]MDL9980194.1 FAD-dependent oxidoreductase [Microbacterium sp. ASV49]
MTAPAHTAIVVGGGSAGAVVARRLVDAGVRVTLLEAGDEDTNPAIHDPSRAGELWHSPQDWDYYTVPQAHAADRRLHLPRGKVLGGSHALNAMIWVRCAPQDFDHWASVSSDAWAWDAVRPVYERIEDVLPVLGDYPLVPIQQSIVDAYVEEGVPQNPDYNGETLDGVSQEQVTLEDGHRVNTWTAYLKPVRDRLDIVTGAHVHSVIVEDGRAAGVRYRAGGSAGGVDADLRADTVILCAGALDSPAILLRSGIGPRAELEELGIPVVLDAPEVGRNLHDHLLSPVIFATSRPVGPPVSGVSVTQTHAFWRSRPELEVPDTQPIHFSVPMWGELEPQGDDGFSLMAGIVSPQSRGALRLTGPSLDDPIEIDLQALADPDDVRALAASVRQVRRVGAQPALAEEWGATEVYPGEAVPDDEVEDWVRRTAITYHHQVGTCRMGADAAAVVDPRLRVNGIAGLRVVDASIMPRITTGNTNAPAVMIGEQGAAFLLEDLGS